MLNKYLAKKRIAHEKVSKDIKVLLNAKAGIKVQAITMTDSTDTWDADSMDTQAAWIPRQHRYPDSIDIQIA